MKYFNLPNYYTSKWTQMVEKLSSHKLESIEQLKTLIGDLISLQSNSSSSSHLTTSYFVKCTSADDEDEAAASKRRLATLDSMLAFFSEPQLVRIVDRVREYALELDTLFVSARLACLSTNNSELAFTHEQVLCLLCHMLLCTMSTSAHNAHWVTFHNWLSDNRTCAVVYLRTLLHFFEQSFFEEDNGSKSVELVRFERRSALAALDAYFDRSKDRLASVVLRVDGSIGDGADAVAEVDFANKDIGYGVSGTQEEILFGASPQMCVAVLFCETMDEPEAIVIRGARRVAAFVGYGAQLSFGALVPSTSKTWTDRTVIAMDALDFSEYEHESVTIEMQLRPDKLERELRKAIAGFSATLDDSSHPTIHTGHWGCGAFAGNKEIKALIQVIAFSISSALTASTFTFFARGDTRFVQELAALLDVWLVEHVSPRHLWRLLNEPDTFKNAIELKQNDSPYFIYKYLVSRLKRTT